KNVDYVYLLWEDLVYQIDNKITKKTKDMYYPRFTKVIINHFMTRDLSIPRRNKVDWHMAKDDHILTIMRFIPQHETIQRYGAILPDSLTNQAMKESEAYKTYYYLATGKATPKPKLKATAKVAKLGKKKQPTLGLETLSEIALSESKQMKIALKRSKTQQYISHASGPGADEGTGVKLGVPDVPSYDSQDEQISWKSSDNEGDDDANKSKDDQDDTDDDDQDDADNDSERTESDNDGDEFVHPKFTTHDEEDKEEESFDLRVQTPSHYESTDDEAYDDAEIPSSSATTLPPPPIPLIQPPIQTPFPIPTTTPSTSLQDLPSQGANQQDFAKN
ncbi:hypothetical protein Tco_1170403, partial [Tanacetum coccineum]